MKYLGLILLLVGALTVSREYSKYMKKRLSECAGFIAFIKHMRMQLHCFLKPPREIGSGYRDDTIEPFLAALSESETLLSAYASSERALSLSVEERRVLGELFSSIGVCYADEGIKLLDSSLSRLTELHSELLSRGGKSVRLVATLSAAFAVGIFILVI